MLLSTGKESTVLLCSVLPTSMISGENDVKN